MNNRSCLGWDYSSRWMGDNKQFDLKDVETGNVVPVDLNSFLCSNADILSKMFRQLENEEKAEYYQNVKTDLMQAIRFGQNT